MTDFNSCNLCGYEIDIKCDERHDLLTLLYNVIEPLNLDIRALDIDITYRKAVSHFFVQEKNNGTFSPIKRRKMIERKLTQLFQYQNMMAEIKIKAALEKLESYTLDGAEAPHHFFNLNCLCAKVQ